MARDIFHHDILIAVERRISSNEERTEDWGMANIILLQMVWKRFSNRRASECGRVVVVF